MFGLRFHPRHVSPRALPLTMAFVVARRVPAAPCGWVFFDGSETREIIGDGDEVIVPGGAFFAKEARRFPDERSAEAEAERLNDASLCLDRPWRATPASAFALRHAQSDAFI